MTQSRRVAKSISSSPNQRQIFPSSVSQLILPKKNKLRSHVWWKLDELKDKENTVLIEIEFYGKKILPNLCQFTVGIRPTSRLITSCLIITRYIATRFIITRIITSRLITIRTAKKNQAHVQQIKYTL